MSPVLRPPASVLAPLFRQGSLRGALFLAVLVIGVSGLPAADPEPASPSPNHQQRRQERDRLWEESQKQESQDKLDEAIAALKQVLVIDRELKPNDLESRAEVLGELAGLYILTEDLPAARLARSVWPSSPNFWGPTIGRFCQPEPESTTSIVSRRPTTEFVAGARSWNERSMCSWGRISFEKHCLRPKRWERSKSNCLAWSIRCMPAPCASLPRAVGKSSERGKQPSGRSRIPRRPDRPRSRRSCMAERCESMKKPMAGRIHSMH